MTDPQYLELCEAVVTPHKGDCVYRRTNRILNWYERRFGREFGPGHVGYRLYYRTLVRGR